MESSSLKAAESRIASIFGISPRGKKPAPSMDASEQEVIQNYRMFYGDDWEAYYQYDLNELLREQLKKDMEKFFKEQAIALEYQIKPAE